ncbi:MAG TPA: class I SAM-dependent methyltransferase, partial [Planctomycetota bacterium]|nr:class I SAM-dependent methyltransferase [Planctomycetota bacterium]
MAASGRTWRRRLRAAGLRDDLDPARLDAALRRTMGPRYVEYAAAAARYSDGEIPAEAFYATARTFDEAALVQSHQAEIVVAAAARLEDAAIARAPAGARVLELGAWTGAFARALAGARPDLGVVATDRLRAFVAAGAARLKAPNLAFAAWDYRRPPPAALGTFDLVLTMCGVDYGWGEPSHALDGLEVRGTPVHRATVAESRPLFRAAARVARPRAVCAAVLRLPNVARLVAAVDAAAAQGWRVDLERSSHLLVDGAVLAVLIFERAPGVLAPPSEESLRAFRRRDIPLPRRRTGRFQGDDALEIHAALAGRRRSEPDVRATEAGVALRVERGVFDGGV